jgi:hypothetical protein
MAERGARKVVKDRERLIALSAGGSAERPIEVATPAVIEGRARSTPCGQCGGELDVAEHSVERGAGGESLRVVGCRCRRCHAPRVIYFRLPVGPS